MNFQQKRIVQQFELDGIYASLHDLKYKSSFLFNLFVAWLVRSAISNDLASSLLELAYISFFHNICNFTQLNLYDTHHDPSTYRNFCLDDHFERIIHYSIVSLLTTFSVTSYLERIKLPFVNKNTPLSCYKKYFFYFTVNLKISNLLLNTTLSLCTGHYL